MFGRVIQNCVSCARWNNHHNKWQVWLISENSKHKMNQEKRRLFWWRLLLSFKQAICASAKSALYISGIWNSYSLWIIPQTCPYADICPFDDFKVCQKSFSVTSSGPDDAIENLWQYLEIREIRMQHNPQIQTHCSDADNSSAITWGISGASSWQVWWFCVVFCKH